MMINKYVEIYFKMQAFGFYIGLGLLVLFIVGFVAFIVWDHFDTKR